MMENKLTFSKADIIRLAKMDSSLAKGEKVYKAAEKELNKIIKFIEDIYSSESPMDIEMRKILKQNFTLLNPGRNKLEKNKYTYEFIDAMLLSTLLKSDVVTLLNSISKSQYSFEVLKNYINFTETFEKNMKIIENNFDEKTLEIIEDNFDGKFKRQKIKELIKETGINKSGIGSKKYERGKKKKIIIKKDKDTIKKFVYQEYRFPLKSFAYYLVSSEYFSMFKKEIVNSYEKNKRIFNRLTKMEKYEFLLNSKHVKKAVDDLINFELDKEAIEEYSSISRLNPKKEKYVHLRTVIKNVLIEINQDICRIEPKEEFVFFQEAEESIWNTYKEIYNHYLGFKEGGIGTNRNSLSPKINDIKIIEFEQVVKDLKSVSADVKKLNASFKKSFKYSIRNQLVELLEIVRDKIRDVKVISEEEIKKELESVLSSVEVINGRLTLHYLDKINKSVLEVFNNLNLIVNDPTSSFDYPIKARRGEFTSRFEKGLNELEKVDVDTEDNDDHVYYSIEQKLNTVLKMMESETKEREESKNPSKEKKDVNLEIMDYVKAELNMPNYNFSEDDYKGKTYAQLINILGKKEEELDELKNEISNIYKLIK